VFILGIIVPVFSNPPIEKIKKPCAEENIGAKQGPNHSNPFPVKKLFVPVRRIWDVTKIVFVLLLFPSFLSSVSAGEAPGSGLPSYTRHYQLSLSGGGTFGEHEEFFALPEFYFSHRDLFGIGWHLDFLINLYHLDLDFSTPKIARSKWTLGSGIEARRVQIRDGEFDGDEFKKDAVFDAFLLNKKLYVGRELFDRLHLFAEYNGKSYYIDKDSRTVDSYDPPSDFDLNEGIVYATYKKLSYDEHRNINYGYDFSAWGSYGVFTKNFSYGLPGDERKQTKSIKRFGGSIRLYMMLFGPETVNLFLEGESLKHSFEAYRVDRYLADNYFTVKLSYSPRIGKKNRVTPHVKVDFTELAKKHHTYFGAGVALEHYFKDKLSLQLSYAYDQNRWGPSIYNATETGEHNIMATITYKWFN
jgi:hypothetical protein